jgi:hypothetical protein
VLEHNPAVVSPVARTKGLGRPPVESHKALGRHLRSKMMALMLYPAIHAFTSRNMHMVKGQVAIDANPNIAILGSKMSHVTRTEVDRDFATSGSVPLLLARMHVPGVSQLHRDIY